MAKTSILILILLAVFAMRPLQAAQSVKELVTVEGVQENEITGIGLVVGLEGTGDKKNPQKDDMIRAWLNNNQLDVVSAKLDSKNAALVNVSGRIPAFAGKGQPLELTVSAIGDAKSLSNGTLLYTKLGFAGEVGDRNTQRVIYATAEGAVKTPEGYAKTMGVVRGILQQEIPSTLVKNDKVNLMMRRPDFVDASRIARQINQAFMKQTNRDIAKATTAGLIQVEVPEEFKDDPVSFIAKVEGVPVLFKDIAAKVRINTKSGMVTFNEKVEIDPVAFTYKDMTFIPIVPGPGGTTTGGGRQAPNINSMFVQEIPAKDPAKTSLRNLVDALNSMRVQPKELVEIVQELHKIGALNAELIVE